MTNAENMTNKEIDLEIKLLKVKIKEEKALLRWCEELRKIGSKPSDISPEVSLVASEILVLRRAITDLENEKYRRALGVD